jgi:hypothetical protein
MLPAALNSRTKARSPAGSSRSRQHYLRAWLKVPGVDRASPQALAVVADRPAQLDVRGHLAALDRRCGRGTATNSERGAFAFVGGEARLFRNGIAKNDLAAAAVQGVDAREAVVVRSARLVECWRSETLAIRAAEAVANTALAELDAALPAFLALPRVAGRRYGTCGTPLSRTTGPRAAACGAATSTCLRSRPAARIIAGLGVARAATGISASTAREVCRLPLSRTVRQQK